MIAAEVALKPCPFCGGAHVGVNKHFWTVVVCFDCGAEGPSPQDMEEDHTEAEAIAAWDRRAPERNPVNG